MSKYIDSESNAINLIGGGTDITGNINSNGDIRIDGTLKGNLKTKGKIVIGESGSVQGEISCKNADIEGTVEGKIIVAELLSLKAKSKINGDIAARRLAIEPGAKFTGNCTMNPESNSINAGEKPIEKNPQEQGKPK